MFHISLHGYCIFFALQGNAVVESEADLPAAFEKLGAKTEIYDVYAEKWAPFTKELAVMIVRTKNDVVSYPVVGNFIQNILSSFISFIFIQ